jgi:hypothetical protein
MAVTSAAALKAAFLEQDPYDYNVDLVDTLDNSVGISGVTATADELNNLDGPVAGTVTASKALVVGANKNLDTLAIADGGLRLGSGAGTAVTSTAAELNLLDGAGAVVASGTEQSNIADLAIIYTSNDPSITPDGSVTFADGSSPTVDELLEAIEELTAKQNLILDALIAFGIVASS